MDSRRVVCLAIVTWSGLAGLTPLAASAPPSSSLTPAAALASLGVAPEHAVLDARTGRFRTLMLAQPLVPGRGNTLSWESLGLAPAPDDEALAQAAWLGLRRFLGQQAAALRIDPNELPGATGSSVVADGEVIQLRLERMVSGVPVRGSYATAVVNHGNLVLLGFRAWHDGFGSPNPTLAADAATAIAVASVASTRSPATPARLEFLPRVNAAGTSHTLVWTVRLPDGGTLGGLEVLVDAHSGAILETIETARAAGERRVVGGVFPTSNDGVGDDGTEQAGWPMSGLFLVHDDPVPPEPRFLSLDDGGNLQACLATDYYFLGKITGNRVEVVDSCNHPEVVLDGDEFDLGFGPALDCSPPPNGPGASQAQRTTFYHAGHHMQRWRAHVPENVQREIAGAFFETNRASTNGSCDFLPTGCRYAPFPSQFEDVICYRPGPTCANPAEIASVIDHEFGHFIDDHDLSLSLSSPSEGIADVYAALRQNESCIGRGLFSTQCTGYGDACTACTGFRDVDWALHSSNTPHDIAFIDAACTPSVVENGPCGGNAHCEGIVVSEAIWDLYRRDLQAAPFSYAPARALEVATRLTFLGAQTVGDWFQCNAGAGTGDGCNADGGYLNFLAIDDDNGNLTDGTPHMSAIFAAFDRHEIACGTPSVSNSGCPSNPATAPVVTATGLDREVRLSWTGVANAESYEVYRAEGVAQCAYGKRRIATTSRTSFVDSGLQNGRQYSYTVIPKGQASSCFGPNSACTSATPSAGVKLEVPAASISLLHQSGDGDEFMDNCEQTGLTFDVKNAGDVTATNVRIVAVSSPSHPNLTVLTTLPRTVTSNLPSCGIATTTLVVNPRGMVHGDTFELHLEITTDQIFPATRPVVLKVDHGESNLQQLASRTFNFEDNFEGWTPKEGLFSRVTGTGGNGTSTFIEAAQFGRERCDRIRSPFLRLSPTSTINLWNNFDITEAGEIDKLLYDGAVLWAPNPVHDDFFPAQNLLFPDSGRQYVSASGFDYFVNCVAGVWGWEGFEPTWGTSGFSASQVDQLAGLLLQLEVTYGQHRDNVHRGFSFDEVTITNFELLVPDGQPNGCSGAIFADGFETGNTNAWSDTSP